MAMTDIKELGLQMRAARIARGWNLRELAQLASVTTSTISRFENGKEIHFSAVARIAEALGLAFTPQCAHEWACRICGRPQGPAGMTGE